jgi:predicted nucleic acid-binding protein
VTQWIDAQAIESLFLSAITVAELRAGLALLPAGKRRAGLQEGLEMRVLPLFAGRVLPFDLGCTQAYAALMAKARDSGLVIASADGYIAAIASANGLTLATRDTGPFKAAGAKVINPWQPSKLAARCGSRCGSTGKLAPRKALRLLLNRSLDHRILMRILSTERRALARTGVQPAGAAG